MRALRAILVAALAMLVLLPATTLAAPSAPQPSCAAGPARSGEAILGTPCDDTIRVGPGISAVYGGGGNDTIIPTPIAAGAECTGECLHLGVGSQTFFGGPGNDVVFGERGNDRLYGGEGDDSLYGGIGDDLLQGGLGNDLLSGGFGFDVIDGEEGDDFVRGDGTVDEVFNGGGGVDTLSYGTGVTPGFTRSPGSYAGFPPSGGERGVYLDLASGVGDNGVATSGGGVDEIHATGFEKVIGSPFADFIVGTGAAETIYGGGGADVIKGEGGGDALHGGADGDSCVGAGPGGVTDCETEAAEVTPRDPARVAVGQMAPPEGAEPELYLSGSGSADVVSASYEAVSHAVLFTLAPGSELDAASTVAGGCEALAPGEAKCALSTAPDSIVLAGMDGNDSLDAAGFPAGTSVVLLGGKGNDSLRGGDASEDVIVDGAGNDHLEAFGGDDALLDNEGLDELLGGAGNDLSLSDTVCDGDLVDGGADRDNASWSKFDEPVEARLDSGLVGHPGGGVPLCGVGQTPNHLQAIEDLEGSGNGDFLYGDAGPNQLLGRLGADTYFAQDGDDSILANSGDTDLVIDCGDGYDSALVDVSPPDPEPVGCELVNGAEPNSFEPPSPPPDLTPPQTRILHRPPRTVFTRLRRRTVGFAFASNEAGSTFRCRLDRGRFQPCRSPRRYSVRLGRHVMRVFAVDAAGNRDPTPATARFRLRRR